jgi:hypothetical protein
MHDTSSSTVSLSHTHTHTHTQNTRHTPIQRIACHSVTTATSRKGTQARKHSTTYTHRKVYTVHEYLPATWIILIANILLHVPKTQKSNSRKTNWRFTNTAGRMTLYLPDQRYEVYSTVLNSGIALTLEKVSCSSDTLCKLQTSNPKKISQLSAIWLHIIITFRNILLPLNILHALLPCSFQMPSQKCEKWLLAWNVCLSVRPPTWDNSGLTKRIFMKYDI